MSARLYLASLAVLSLAAGVFLHPVAGIVVAAIGIVAPFVPMAIVAVGAVAMLLLATASPAFAQTAASATSWDYSGLLSLVDQVLITVIIPILGALGAGIAAKVFKVQGEKEQSLVRDTVDNVLAKGVDYGKAFLASRIGSGAMTIDVHNELVANILAYATAHAPDALQYFGITSEKLESMIIARLSAAGIPVPALPGPTAAAPLTALAPAA